MKIHVVVLLLSVSLLCSSCMYTHYRGKTRYPISFTSNLGVDKKYERVRTVDETYRRKWLVLYLIPIGKDGSDMISEASSGGDGMVNLKIHAYWDLVDVLVTNLTFGILCTRSIQITGDIVKFK